MIRAERRFYASMVLLLLAGWGWIAYNLLRKPGGANFSVCPVKLTTGMPCPSCGTTRSVLSLFQGDLLQAFLFNPLGFPVLFFLILLPLWILADALRQYPFLFHAFRRGERWLHRHPATLYVFFILLALNWVWSIYKRI